MFQFHNDTFFIPQAYIPKTGKRIMGLQNPTAKMSKSDDSSQKDYILLLDDLAQIKNKIKSAVTDSDTKVIFDLENKPGISNLLTIYSALTNEPIKVIEERYVNASYGTFKDELSTIIVDTIRPIQERYHEIINSKELDDILDKGRDYAKLIADRKIKRVYEKIGLGRKQ